MANNWTGSDFVLVANVDLGALLVDSSPLGTNTLTNLNGVGQSVDAIQGDRSAVFARSAQIQLRRTNANLNTTFPGKSSTGSPDFTIVGRIKHASLTAGQYYVAKWGTAGNDNCYLLWANGGALALAFHDDTIQYNSPTIHNMLTGRWYFFAITFNGTTKGWTARIWDDTASSLVADTSGTSTVALSTVSTADFKIGGLNIKEQNVDGLMDEIVVAPSVHSIADTDDIWNQVFGDQGVGAVPQAMFQKLHI